MQHAGGEMVGLLFCKILDNYNSVTHSYMSYEDMEQTC